MSKNKAVCHDVQTYFESSLLASSAEKLLVHYHDLCVQRCSCLLLSSDAFQKFSPCEVYKKVLSALSRLLLPKTKLFALKIRRILDVLSLQVLQKRFWAHYNDFCVHKRSILPLSSDAF